MPKKALALIVRAFLIPPDRINCLESTTKLLKFYDRHLVSILLRWLLRLIFREV